MVTYIRPLPIGSFCGQRDDHATLVVTLAFFKKNPILTWQCGIKIALDPSEDIN
jgi:hypothetical protein